jgi:hypothetical protein
VCTVENANGDTSRYCFANGVKVASLKGSECNNRDDSVYASDGTLCYVRSSLAYAGHACEGSTTTWKDGSGTLIATRTSSGSSGQGLQITCASGGERALCTDWAHCGWDALTVPNCASGACPE